MKKHLSYALALSLLASFAVSCGGGETPAPSGNTAANQNPGGEAIQTEAVTEDNSYRSDIPDDADYGGVSDRELVVGQYLAEGIELAQAACNKLCRLRAEVQNDNFLLLHRSKRIH